MSEGLLTQWRDRVVEAETEISVVQEDITALIQQRKELKQDIARYDKLVQREKQDMLKRLEEVEGQAQELELRCQKTLQQKARVEEMYIQTLDNYESMHDVVKDIQRVEGQLQEREDLEAVLQRESFAWAEEEHGLRTKLNTLQSAIKGSRKQHQEEMTNLEAELATTERQLQQVRHERQGMTALQQGDVGKYSRRGSVHTSESDAKNKEQQFITSNLSSGFPTRQLRSCLKSTATTTDKHFLPETKIQSGHKSNDDSSKLPALHSYSAPVSRAPSQTLVTGGDGVPVAIDSTLATPHRAYSYAAGKKVGSRKRDISVLGDATNRY